MLTVYRVISYLLLMVACFLTLSILLLLGVALANPPLLLPVFLLCGVVLYSFSSFQFLSKGITMGQTLKPGKKDFIKANAYVALFFGVMNLIQATTLIFYPPYFQETMDQFTSLNLAEAGMSVDKLYKIMQTIIWFLLFYAIALIIHIQLTFRLLKTYASAFHAGEDRMS